MTTYLLTVLKARKERDDLASEPRTQRISQQLFNSRSRSGLLLHRSQIVCTALCKDLQSFGVACWSSWRRSARRERERSCSRAVCRVSEQFPTILTTY